MDSLIVTLGLKYKQLKEMSEGVEAELKKLNAEWLDVETQLLEAMVNEGVKTIKVDGLGAFTMKVTNYLNVNAANKPSFYEYLKSSGNGGLLKEDVNPRTLNSFLKEHLAELTQQKMQTQNVDEVTARNESLEFLNKQGANYFTKREIAYKGDK